MSDEEYIRKAVELADGWVLGRNDVLHSPCGYFADLTDQPVLDALAAQLVRQVDATDASWVVTTSKDAHVMTDDGIQAAQAIGPDRTMNTIKAIVDSGVLGGQQ